MRVVFLDSGPLGLVTKPPGRPDADRCRAWVGALDAAGARVVVPEIAAVVPEIADDEVRRNLLDVGATAGLRRLTGSRPCSGMPRSRRT
jgi:hypothetical protein